jgi:hypothetical protein
MRCVSLFPGFLAALLVCRVLLCTGAAWARTIPVGSGQEFLTPSAGIAAAQPGDIVHIAAGRYFDCAFVRQDRITIEGDGPATVLTDKPCGGKAILVIDSKDVTVRNLTLQRARVPDGNGAGIRAEGGNLTIEGVRFINNQDGILAADNPQAFLRVFHSEFIGNGTCQNGGGCAHGIYVNHLALLHIEKSRFVGTKEGHHIKSKALRTEIIATSVEDGPDGTSSYLVDIPVGGNLLIDDCTFEKGPNSANHTAGVVIGAEGVEQPTDEIIVRNNQFRNDMDYPTIFIRNLTAQPAELDGNRLFGTVRPLEGDGYSHS